LFHVVYQSKKILIFFLKDIFYQIILTCCRISRNCFILLRGISRVVICSIDELSELVDGSVVNGGRNVFVNPTFLSRNRRLLGGKESISAVVFDCLVFIVELLVLLPSPAPVLEHELASSFGLVVVVIVFEIFSTKEKIYV
jgi:hypothetical protein